MAETKPPRLALTRAEAAAAIGVSVDSFERYIQPELRIVRAGRLRLIPISELQLWLDTNAARTLE
jgi:excisionase family DNA binding protein